MKIFLDTNICNAATSKMEILSPTEFAEKYL